MSARNSYDDRLFNDSKTGSWFFCILYAILFLKEYFGYHDFLLVEIAGAFLAAALMYEIVRSHTAVERIVRSYDSEIKDLKNQIKKLDDELFEIKRHR